MCLVPWTMHAGATCLTACVSTCLHLLCLGSWSGGVAELTLRFLAGCVCRRSVWLHACICWWGHSFLGRGLRAVARLGGGGPNCEGGWLGARRRVVVAAMGHLLSVLLLSLCHESLAGGGGRLLGGRAALLAKIRGRRVGCAVDRGCIGVRRRPRAGRGGRLVCLLRDGGGGGRRVLRQVCGGRRGGGLGGGACGMHEGGRRRLQAAAKGGGVGQVLYLQY